MKKAIAVITILGFVLMSLTACMTAEQKQERAVQDLYNTIPSMSFSDESILTEDEQSTRNALRQQIEQAYHNNDPIALQKVKEDCDAFRAPIQARINEIEAEKRRVTEAAMQSVVADAQAISSMLNSFSFGTMSLTITSRGHSVVFSYQYLVDAENTGYGKSALETSTSLLAYLFQPMVTQLEDAGVSSPSVIVEYVDKNGKNLYSKEFK